eukprot:TRINITY_DN3332_c1_g1_i2.p1 TRINITY_DN3332_c1_g1~~TRINITY_DN3332_c1_g1_i2.p1  ORF type:complete len:179 (+),score=42.53 TRINITY_DN3332_c1_g1_i2:54-539(+)
MVDVAVPDALPVMEARSAAANPAPKKPKQGLTEEEKREHAIKYFVQNKVAVFLDVMLTHMYRELPPDPIDWAIAFLVRHETLEEVVREQLGSGAADFSTQARRYAAEWKVPFLIDELLADILRSEPKEPDRFAMTWFRWNKHSFIARHFRGEAPVFEISAP